MTVARHMGLLAGLLALGLAGCVGNGQRDALSPQVTAGAADEAQLIIVAVGNDTPVTAPRPASTRPGYAGTVYRASDAARALMRDVAREYGLTEVAAWPIQVLTLHCAVLRIPAGAEREPLLQKISGDPRVKLAQAMNGFAPRTQSYNDPYLAVQRGFQSIDAAGAQQWSRGEKIRVAVIDTGLDATHPDFGGRVVVRRNFVDNDARRFERDRHGTAVAGVISASANNSLGIVGVAPGVEVIALKACWQLDEQNDTAHCNSLTLAQALAAAISENAQVVNLSLAGPRDPLLNALVAAGTARGVLYVGAAPADAPADGFPGGAPGVIPVDMADAAVARNGVLRAPGREVVTLMPGGRYDFVSGSSLATAHVSGAVALLLARDRRLDRNAIYRLLAQSEASPGMAGTAPINACLAVAKLVERASCGKVAVIPAAATAASAAQ
jgi:subtilisin family serine protease